jgi:hypothetical protein
VLEKIANVSTLATGMEKMHNATNIYIRSVSKRKEQDDKEKMLPLDVLSQSLIYHGEEFEHDSTFGTCLTSKSHRLITSSSISTKKEKKKKKGKDADLTMQSLDWQMRESQDYKTHTLSGRVLHGWRQPNARWLK